MTELMAALDRLAERLYIEPAYIDVWQRRQDIPDDVKRRLIAAMGFPAATDSEVEASLRAVEERAWWRVLPPVVVLAEEASMAVTVTLPDALAGQPLHWVLHAEDGTVHRGDADPRRFEAAESESAGYSRRRMPVPVDLPCGYHHLTVEARDARGAPHAATTTLIVAPRRCVGVEEVAGPDRVWGFGVQLYGLRSASEWGIGDFGVVARLAEMSAGLGASLLGLSPLHALFPAEPGRCGPYAPSSRSFLNALFIDVEAVADFAECAAARAEVAGADFVRRLGEVRAAQLVDYAAVAALKLPVLDALYRCFSEGHLAEPTPTPRGQAFREFCAAMGEELRRHAIFEALSEQQQRAGAGADWRLWPQPLRRPDGPEVAAFAREHAERVAFFQYLQWVADLQLGEAARRGRSAGMLIGLYRDLAVATDPTGAAAWAGQEWILDAVSVGAPPDLYNPNGQSWGIAPFSPIGLVEAAYAPFIANLRANMRHAGAVRIDHVMGLMHLYCIPPGGGRGAYVSYPFEDLLRIVALESRRHGCIVIGEDLGTVPDAFRPAMQAAGILSYRLFYFERDGEGRFLPPEAYPVEALVAATTHDLPTLAGFWTGHDQLWRARFRLYPDQASLSRDRHQRARDREELVAALWRQRLLPRTRRGRDKAEDSSVDALRELTLAVHCYLASTPGRILMLQLEDVLGEIEQPNLPGTIDEHPNWRRRARLTVEEIVADPAARALVAALRRSRRRTSPRDKVQPV